MSKVPCKRSTCFGTPRSSRRQINSALLERQGESVRQAERNNVVPTPLLLLQETNGGVLGRNLSRMLFRAGSRSRLPTINEDAFEWSSSQGFEGVENVRQALGGHRTIIADMEMQMGGVRVPRIAEQSELLSPPHVLAGLDAKTARLQVCIKSNPAISDSDHHVVASYRL